MRLPNWCRLDRGGVRFYSAWNFQSSGLVKHGFSTRIGGESLTPFDTLNLGLTVEDDKYSVLRNRRAFALALGLDADRIVVPNQVHGKIVRLVTASDAGKGALDHADSIPDTDALITNTPNLTLSLHFADCGSVFLLDPVNKAIGLVHSGWKGTAAKIVTETIQAMVREFGSDPKKLLAAIGPSIGRCCYDVGEDVAMQLFKAFPHDERVISRFSTGKWSADLKMANLILLRNAGVEDSNIAISEHCTCCCPDEFFSYRRDGKTGRMGGWLSLC